MRPSSVNHMKPWGEAEAEAEGEGEGGGVGVRVLRAYHLVGARVVRRDEVCARAGNHDVGRLRLGHHTHGVGEDAGGVDHLRA